MCVVLFSFCVVGWWKATYGLNFYARAFESVVSKKQCCHKSRLLLVVAAFALLWLRCLLYSASIVD